VFESQGHEVKLLPARAVRAFVSGNKTDAVDARALWRAAQQPDMNQVAVKTEAQQAVLSVHRVRSLLVKQRVARVNALRGLLVEFGVVMPRGHAGLRAQLEAALEKITERVPAMLIETLRNLRDSIKAIDEQIGAIEKRLRQHLVAPAQRAERRIAAIPGVGLLTATAAVATMGRAGAFASGGQFAAWVGLVPRQFGTGGRVRLMGISKRGDTYLRTLLIHGARSALAHDKNVQAWAAPRLARRPKAVVIVALANKMARTIWALLAHDRDYRGDYVSRAPARA
jgi:transposase